jgi:hypothetical protein
MFTYAKGLTVWHEAIHSYGDDSGERKEPQRTFNKTVFEQATFDLAILAVATSIHLPSYHSELPTTRKYSRRYNPFNWCGSYINVRLSEKGVSMLLMHASATTIIVLIGVAFFCK